MENLIQRLKSTTLFTLIMGFLSLTWLIIDYFLMRSIMEEGLTKFSLEWILMIASGIVYVVFTASVFIMIYFSLRVVGKLKSTFYSTKTEAPQSNDPAEEEDK